MVWCGVLNTSVPSGSTTSVPGFSFQPRGSVFFFHFKLNTPVEKLAGVVWCALFFVVLGCKKKKKKKRGEGERAIFDADSMSLHILGK